MLRLSSLGGGWSGEYGTGPVGRYEPWAEIILAGAMESGGRGLPINVGLGFFRSGLASA